jgi:23S rRNA pseudouridine1911/1915/1917 synthase
LHTLWVDRAFLAVFKPAGIPVFPPHADPDGDCLLARVLAAHPDQRNAEWPFGFDGGLAHRLDTSTSGQVLVARNPFSLARLRQRFKRGELTKRYRLVTAKPVVWAENGCVRAMAHARRRKGRMVVQRGNNTLHRGRWIPAETRFQRVVDLPGDLVELSATMRTGVMHQIRVHAGFLGVALAGDRHYGGGPRLQGLPDEVRFLLHHEGLLAPGLEPVTAPLPEYWPTADG